MKAHVAGCLAVGIWLALPSGYLRAEDQTHEMVIEFNNNSEFDVTLGSDGTKISEDTKINGKKINLGKIDNITVKKGKEFTSTWQIILCLPENTDSSDPDTSEKTESYSLRVSYTDKLNGVEDATLCKVTYRYDEDKKNSKKRCILRVKSLTTPKDNVSDDENIYTPGGGQLRDHDCIDDRTTIGPHVRVLTLKSTH